MRTLTALSEGLVEFWPLNESSGTRDGSLGVMDLTESASTGAANFNPEFDVSEQNTACAEFTGTTYLSVESSSLNQIDPTKGFSLSAWCNFAGFPFADSAAVVGKASTDGNEYLIQINAFSTAGRRFVFFMGSNLQYSTSNVLNNDLVPSRESTWYHLVGVYYPYTFPSPAMQLFVNNVRFGVATGLDTANLTTGTSRFGVGARVDSGSGGQKLMNGKVCNVGMWRRCLTDNEVGDLWNGGYTFSYPFRKEF